MITDTLQKEKMWCKYRIKELRRFMVANAHTGTHIRMLRINGQSMQLNEEDVQKLLRTLEAETCEYYKLLIR